MKSIDIHIKKIRTGIILVTLTGLLLQIFVDQSLVNILCAMIAATASIITTLYVFHGQKWLIYPVSSLIIFGFGITQSTGPLLFTALENRSIIFNLKVPEQIFINTIVCNIALIVSHIIYRKNSGFQKFRFYLSNFWVKLKFFQPLSRSQAITSGLFGLGAMIFVYWFKGLGSETSLIKFIQGFVPFTYLPLVLLLKPLQNAASSAKRADWIVNLLFLFAILTASLGSNSRGSFAIPIITYFIGLGFLWIYQKLKIKLNYGIAIMLSIYFVLPLFNDLATAMVMARGLRNDISAIQLISETLNYLDDRQAIELYRQKSTMINASEWNETYVSNPFLARFANLKFSDNALDLSEDLSDSKKAIFQDFTIGRLVSMLPGPLLNLLSFSSELKLQVTSQSFGDQLYFLSSGNKSTIGGFRTGHFYGTGLAIFGWFYPIIYLILLIPFFIFNESLVLIRNHNLIHMSNEIPVFSSLSIINFFYLISQGNIETITDYVAFIIRVFPQQIILFLILMRLTYFFEKPTKLNI